LHATAVHTEAGTPFDPLIPKSIKLPAATATVPPVTAHDPPLAAVHVNAVSDIAPGVPVRSVTVTAFPCCEYTDSPVAVHAAGIHVITAVPSVALEFVLFTE
jgi:hypothetical protein